MKFAGQQQTRSGERLKNLLRENRAAGARGVYSVCSAHPWVLDTAIQQAFADGGLFLVESTSSQVNQEGGYTGQTPQVFAQSIRSAATQAGLAAEQIVLGGDHLGPFPWRHKDASVAMEKAYALVRACVLAGYQKIHLDASMPCADDGTNPLPANVIAKRAAVLAEAAEKALTELPPESDAPVYVIGTEVPAPGGETEPGMPPAVTTADHVQQTLETFQCAFAERKLFAAWERTIALVVQPGVEFGDDVVFPYERAKARSLSLALPANLSIVYEAHSTDYQSTQSLRQMVEDHFAILKVGPWLTFAFREAIFALSAIERELLSQRKAIRFSKVRETLDSAMLRNPSHWRSYYRGDDDQLRLARAYSYSDRCRYYWHETDVQEEIKRLLANLENCPLPVTLVSQYFPLEYESVRQSSHSARAADLIRLHIQGVLGQYAAACGVKA